MQADKPEQQEIPDPTRRRLARGGLAGTVVLGSLISRPVLGAVPYNCTISGRMSGNTSSHGTPVVCSTLGQSQTVWLAAGTWPGLANKGVLPPDTSGTYPWPGIGAVFNGFSGLATSFRYNNLTPPAVAFNTTLATRPATLLQVLSTANAGASFVFGRETVVTMLNSIKFAGTYPLTPAQVAAMYNAVYNGGTFPVNGTTNWTLGDVQTYFKSLHPP